MRHATLLAGAGLGLGIAALLAPATGDALGRLHKARIARDALTARVDAPERRVPLVAPGLSLGAQNAAAAQARIAARVTALARSGGVLVEQAAPLSLPTGLAGVRVRLSGPEKAVLTLAETVERGRPLMRFTRWKIVSVSGGVRLDGDLVGAWQ